MTKEARRLPAPWRVEDLPGGFKVVDANGVALAYCYGDDALAGKTGNDVLTRDEARRIAANIAKLPGLLMTGKDEPGNQAGGPESSSAD